MKRLWDLPSGWCWRKFQDVAKIASNLVDPSEYPNHLHLAPNHVIPEAGRHESLVPVSEDGVRSKKHLFKPGQIVYSKIRPYLRKAVIARTEGLCSADMYPIETELEPRFLMWWMLSDEFTKLALKGRSVIPKINQRELNVLPVPVPPLDEQRTIVEALERMMSICDAVASDARRGLHRLEVLRAAIAHAAVSGRLADPRGTARSEDGVWDTPAHWQWVPVADVADVRGGIQKTPARRPRNNVAPFLRVANVQRNSLDLDDVHQVELEPGELARYRLQHGDLLVVEGNGSLQHIGRSAVWDGSIQDCVHQNHLIRVRPGSKITSEWLNLVWNSPACAAQIQRVAQTTSGLYTLSTSKVGAVCIPLPPLEVQRQLAQLHRARLSHADRLERVVAATEQRLPVLRRSILKAAFEGRLADRTQDVLTVDELEEVTA